MTYGSSCWHKQQGRAIIDNEIEMAAAENRRKRDEKAVEKFGEGESVKVVKNGEEMKGRIIEIIEDDAKITVENWNNCVTVEARKVEYY